MKQDNYLKILRQYLHALPQDQIEEIIQEYRDYYKLGLSEGKSEEEISKEFEHPRVISRRFIDASDIPKENAVISSNFIKSLGKAGLIIIVFMAMIIGISLLAQKF